MKQRAAIDMNKADNKGRSNIRYIIVLFIKIAKKLVLISCLNYFMFCNVDSDTTGARGRCCFVRKDFSLSSARFMMCSFKPGK